MRLTFKCYGCDIFTVKFYKAGNFHVNCGVNIFYYYSAIFTVSCYMA